MQRQQVSTSFFEKKAARKPLAAARVVAPPAVFPETDAPDISVFDRALHAAQARLTGGLSPAGIGIAYMDWLLHLTNQPGRQVRMFHAALQDSFTLWRQALGQDIEPVTPPAGDHRFAHPGWQDPKYFLAEQAFLRTERWWRDATSGVAGVAAPHERVVGFVTRQLLDVFSPSNNPLLNPEVAAATKTRHGENFEDGAKFLLEDLTRTSGPHALPMPPGKDLATTPGRVVFRNALIELIQYTPATATVRPEPILIVPAWIMKYYILDLSPANSMVKFLVDQGFTVFCISWINPGAALRGMGLDDYRRLGVMAAIDAITAICGAQKIHAVGYCLGGTLLSITAAAMARDHDERLNSLTLLAAQTDFTEAGELQLFISESQLAFLDDVMWSKGYLDSAQMAGAFEMLRSNDLVWSRLIRRYFLGEDDHPNDMMSWNMDATRMPFKMHSEYLHKLFLNNDLAEGRLLAGGRRISLSDIHLPGFVIGTETDHIAPWRSVYKFLLLNTGPITFILTSGGHNAGVVSEPGHRHRHFRLLQRPLEGLLTAPDDFMEQVPPQDGSWWLAWVDWLAQHSGAPVAPPEIGHAQAGYPPLEAAPGRYVLQR